MKLSKKLEKFCTEYAVDHNGSRAAAEAGWNENTAASAASRLLKREEIRARIAELESNAAETCGLTVVGVIKSLMETRDRCKQAVPVMEYDKAAREYVESGEYRFDAAGANRADELLGKHLGMFEEKTTLKADLEVTERELNLLERYVERIADADEEP